MKLKYYLGAILSNLALLLYFLPWTYGANHTVLGFYIIAFLWFMIGWIILLVQIFLCIKLRRLYDMNWKHHLIASVFIAISYIGFFGGILNGYIVTV